jgi:hypothetical protein
VANGATRSNGCRQLWRDAADHGAMGLAKVIFLLMEAQMQERG